MFIPFSAANYGNAYSLPNGWGMVGTIINHQMSVMRSHPWRWLVACSVGAAWAEDLGDESVESVKMLKYRESQ